jgi:hypothetical protein
MMETATVSFTRRGKDGHVFGLLRTVTGESVEFTPEDVVAGKFKDLKPRQTIWVDRAGGGLEVYARHPSELKERLDFWPCEAGFETTELPVEE